MRLEKNVLIESAHSKDLCRTALRNRRSARFLINRHWLLFSFRQGISGDCVDSFRRVFTAPHGGDLFCRLRAQPSSECMSEEVIKRSLCHEHGIFYDNEYELVMNDWVRNRAGYHQSFLLCSARSIHTHSYLKCQSEVFFYIAFVIEQILQTRGNVLRNTREISSVPEEYCSLVELYGNHSKWVGWYPLGSCPCSAGARAWRQVSRVSCNKPMENGYRGWSHCKQLSPSVCQRDCIHECYQWRHHWTNRHPMRRRRWTSLIHISIDERISQEGSVFYRNPVGICVEAEARTILSSDHPYPGRVHRRRWLEVFSSDPVVSSWPAHGEEWRRSGPVVKGHTSARESTTKWERRM